MQFPKNILELSKAGYDWLNAGVCRGCHAEFQWYATPNFDEHGNRKRIPISILEDRSVVAHFAICPARKAFIHANKTHAARAAKNLPPKPVQGKLAL